MSGTKIPASGLIPSRKPTEQELQAQAEQQLNQLIGELRLLEAYYQEVSTRQQTASAALSDSRSALEALTGLSKNPKSEILLPIGAGLLLPAKDIEVKSVVVSVGSGVALEKSVTSATLFLETRQKELQSALVTLDQQRREIGARIEAGRATLQELSGQS
ncbi:MAG: prefoldin subunit alpha [Nitrososphaerales archaeon]